MEEKVTVCLIFIVQHYGLTLEEAKVLFKQVWIQTFGICVLCAAKVCHFSEEELDEIMGREFQGIFSLIKSTKGGKESERKRSIGTE